MVCCSAPACLGRIHSIRTFAAHDRFSDHQARRHYPGTCCLSTAPSDCLGGQPRPPGTSSDSMAHATGSVGALSSAAMRLTPADLGCIGTGLRSGDCCFLGDRRRGGSALEEAAGQRADPAAAGAVGRALPQGMLDSAAEWHPAGLADTASTSLLPDRRRSAIASALLPSLSTEKTCPKMYSAYLEVAFEFAFASRAIPEFPTSLL